MLGAGQREIQNLNLENRFRTPSRGLPEASLAGSVLRQDTGTEVENRPGHKLQHNNLSIAKQKNLNIAQLNNLKMIWTKGSKGVKSPFDLFRFRSRVSAKIAEVFRQSKSW